jgi:hypothetical protein
VGLAPEISRCNANCFPAKKIQIMANKDGKT